MEKISVYIDNNIWDELYKYKIDLSEELPSSEFSLAITKEANFEIDSIPHAHIKEYAKYQITKCNIRTDAIFGFYDESLPREMQRFAGFGSEDDPTSGGRLLSEDEAAVFITENRQEVDKARSIRPTGLYKHEADISLAARATHSIVLTTNIKGALKRAHAKEGSRVIDMKLYQPKTRLYDFIITEMKKFQSPK